MQAIKSIGSTLLGIAIFIGIIIATVLLFTLGAKLAFTIQPFINWLAGILFLTNVFALVAAIAPRARGISGLIIYVSSYVYGLGTWIFGLAVTLALWGWLAVIIGLLLGGVGVVPIGMLAAMFNGEWGVFWTLFLSLILTYGSRIIGTMLISNAENQTEYYDENTTENIIDIEPEIHKRTWKDIE
ncbi:hypothetical protein KC874_01525 [Candidatus Saccharibacteria bacterium]|nr:hypothetical protein [Candidatus Saccharibacteria bacterium]